MTVRIVDEKPDPTVVKRTVCRNCGVKLEYLPIDVKERIVTDYGGGSDTIYWIDCPKCQNHVSLKYR
jgi:RNase P subunit RPR2